MDGSEEFGEGSSSTCHKGDKKGEREQMAETHRGCCCSQDMVGMRLQSGDLQARRAGRDIQRDQPQDSGRLGRRMKEKEESVVMGSGVGSTYTAPAPPAPFLWQWNGQVCGLFIFHGLF